ncbi:MAG: CAP domain-containing protein [Bacillota bacterium]
MKVRKILLITTLTCLLVLLLIPATAGATTYTYYRSSGSTVTYRYTYYINGRQITVIQYSTPRTTTTTPQPVPQPAPQSAPAPAPIPAPSSPPSVGLAAEEQQMLNLVNAERQKQGLRPLIAHAGLTELARKKSRDMIQNNYFSHISPTYGSPFDMMRAAGISYRTAGENIAGASTVERAHLALMNSDGHRRNILNPAYTHVGIGIIRGGAYGLMITQMFIGN